MITIPSIVRVALLVVFSVLAFSGNSILCKIAFQQTGIDAVSFTTIRLLSGSFFLLVLVFATNREKEQQGSWSAAFCLFAYAAGFSIAYETVGAGTGALLLFGSVQVTMISSAFLRGEMLSPIKILGLLTSFLGLVFHFYPDATRPTIPASLLMLGAGVAWGGYSILGRQNIDPIGVTSGNFLRASVLGIFFSSITWNSASIDAHGAFLAIVTGAFTSGLGYIVWYTLLPKIKALQASVIQLCVPLLTALAGVIFLDEHLTIKFSIVCFMVLFGILLVVLDGHFRS